MALRIEIDPADIAAIANRVIEQLLPLLKSREEPDELMDIDQLCPLLKKSKGQISWTATGFTGAD